ncbi:alpha/beta-hydrolase [Cryphonectria parasitica EP155]|uniref:Alpha/beta-hydrolase n=1 Tax=Cryphonectria parasitica (strain ATCC 38755 / EP155) TaxID=660469 RepID=A0A9P4XY07_CRYP1|nr:alpha/beta-hydrolase [Cryphonectria parasitica EP155]KAF3762956.1 alpha/beta-hydrolase [Cryphonectria parasitica EP155]
MLDQNDTTHFDLSGALIYDPCIGDCGWVQEEVPTVPYVLQNSNLFGLNESFTETLVASHESCGYAAYIDEYLTFPTGGIQPPSPYWGEGNCDVFDLVNNAALEVNPCFDIYEINQACPILWDVLGFPTELEYAPAGYDLYFNRTDVKEALHAPLDINWAECANEDVFVDGEDSSAQPNIYVLPKVIEATNRVLVANGDYDFILMTNGTLLSIQNMTWNGALGFQTEPSTPINIEIPDLAWAEVFDENYAEGVDGPQGTMGIQHYERGLLWAETYQSGHMEPEFQPRVAYRHLEWVLNRTQTL